MTRTQEIDAEIARLIVRLRPEAAADFEIPRMVYSKILDDNKTRKKPYRVSYERIQRIMHEILI